MLSILHVCFNTHSYIYRGTIVNQMDSFSNALVISEVLKSFLMILGLFFKYLCASLSLISGHIGMAEQNCQLKVNAYCEGKSSGANEIEEGSVDGTSPKSYWNCAYENDCQK